MAGRAPGTRPGRRRGEPDLDDARFLAELAIHLEGARRGAVVAGLPRRDLAGRAVRRARRQERPAAGDRPVPRRGDGPGGKPPDGARAAAARQHGPRHGHRRPDLAVRGRPAHQARHLREDPQAARGQARGTARRGHRRGRGGGRRRLGGGNGITRSGITVQRDHRHRQLRPARHRGAAHGARRPARDAEDVDETRLPPGHAVPDRRRRARLARRPAVHARPGDRPGREAPGRDRPAARHGRAGNGDRPRPPRHRPGRDRAESPRRRISRRWRPAGRPAASAARPRFKDGTAGPSSPGVNWRPRPFQASPGRPSRRAAR